MLYKTFRRNLKTCPFCKPVQKAILAKNSAFLTYALAPYHPYHLLILPKRHIVSFLKLNKSEQKDIDMLIRLGITKLHKLGMHNISVLVRDGSLRGVNKSITHLHYHLIPNTQIGDVDHAGRPRVILDSKQIEKLLKKLK
jgi:histidine triad (HIT) family protein